ncbi:MAG: flagellar protein FlbB [Alphaproteobacteria bacterium]|nr:flagellar protein FlbB [Alphaproteobacteria bacterium]
MVRLGYVASDITQVINAAEAQQMPDDKALKSAEAAKAEGEKKPEAKHAEAAASSAKQEAPAVAKAEDAPAASPNVWADADDADLEYSDVKSEMFKELAAKRKANEEKEKSLTQREALLKAAEAELERKYQELENVRNEIQGLLKKQSEEEEQRITSLVKIYEGMKAKDAANIFNTLDSDILVEVLGRMSERKSAPILAEMNPDRARLVTILLAEQKKLPAITDEPREEVMPDMEQSSAEGLPSASEPAAGN